MRRNALDGGPTGRAFRKNEEVYLRKHRFFICRPKAAWRSASRRTPKTAASRSTSLSRAIENIARLPPSNTLLPVKKSAPVPAQPILSLGLRRYLYLTAAITGAAIMVVEILGAKMLSPFVGTSHFVLVS
jgi:hypothetical protein